MRRIWLAAVAATCAVAGGALWAQQPLQRPAAARVSVPTAPAEDARPTRFHDGHFGVRFEVPPGWEFRRRDGELSTFHMDARSASPRAQMRGMASLTFNPFPMSVLSGATFYYSVERHASAMECAEQAAAADGARDVQDIAGMEFRHGHDEHGQICTEGRDEVYTAFRKGACYRFDLEVNTFCSISSGADDLTERQMGSLEQRMVDILSSVVLDWKKGASHPVPAPAIVKSSPKKAEPELTPRSAAPLHQGE